MDGVRRPLEDEVADFWGMAVGELDLLYIQKPVDQLHINVTRWRKLPTAAFRELNKRHETSGEVERLEHECFIHPQAPRYLSDGEWCKHTPGAAYVVDPDAPDRVEQFMALWRSPAGA